MTDIASLFSATEQKYNLPPGILAATAQVESSNNPKAISPQGAEGLMQLLPSTAQNLGADPMNVPQAVDAAGRLWRQNLNASGGNIDRAAMMYHGGTDPRNWGPKTEAYPAKLAAALGSTPTPQPQQGGGDPVEAALSGGTPSSPPAQAAANDPIETALAGPSQDRQAEIAAAQAQAAKQLQAGDEKGAIATLAQHNLVMAPGELDAYHAGKRSAGFDHVDQLPDQQPQPQTNQALGFLEGVTKPLDNAATWLERGADKIGLAQPLNELSASLGLAPTQEAANATHQAYFNGQEAQGQAPGAIGKFVGEVAGTLPAVLATKNPWIAGGISGGLTTDDPNNLKQTGIDALIGALGGKAAHAVTGAIAGAISPTVSAAVQKLNDLGVQLTPGQIMGGALRRMEDALTSIPGVGDMINSAQRRSVISLNNGVINDRVLGPIGQSLPSGLSGRDAVSYADDAVTKAYHDLLPQLSLRADKPLYDSIGQALGRSVELPPDRAAQVHNIIKNSVVDRFNPDWSMSGDTFKDVDSKLGFLQRQYSSAQDPDQQKMGEIFGDVKAALRDKLAEQNPAHSGPLNNINQAFANLVRVQGAASSTGAKDGVFTPSQLAQAVRRFNGSVRKKDYANGDALLQDVSDAAQSVLPRSVPDSGTPYRSIMAFLLGGGAKEIPKVAPLAIPSLLYTKTGQKAFQAAVLAPRGPGAKALAKALTKLKAPLAVAGGGAAAQATDGR